jgi:hypothetical protein
MTYGGQAVIEGVMMRGQKALAIAMRAPDGNIVVHQENLAAVYRSRIAKIPFLHGSILLWDADWECARDSFATPKQGGRKLKVGLYLTVGLSLVLIGLLASCYLGGAAEHISLEFMKNNG